MCYLTSIFALKLSPNLSKPSDVRRTIKTTLDVQSCKITQGKLNINCKDKTNEVFELSFTTLKI